MQLSAGRHEEVGILMNAAFLAWFQRTASKISVPNRILIVGVIPLCGVFALSTIAYLEKQRAVSEVHEVALLAQLMPYTSQYCS